MSGAGRSQQLQTLHQLRGLGGLQTMKRIVAQRRSPYSTHLRDPTKMGRKPEHSGASPSTRVTLGNLHRTRGQDLADRRLGVEPADQAIPGSQFPIQSSQLPVRRYFYLLVWLLAVHDLLLHLYRRGYLTVLTNEQLCTATGLSLPIRTTRFQGNAWQCRSSLVHSN